MEHLDLALPDVMFHELAVRARSEGKTPDQYVLDAIKKTLADTSDDPLVNALGTLESNTSNIAERHDEYLAQVRGGPVS